MATEDAALGDSTLKVATEKQNAPGLDELINAAKTSSYKAAMDAGFQAIAKFLDGVPYRRVRDDLREVREVREASARTRAARTKRRAKRRAMGRTKRRVKNR